MKSVFVELKKAIKKLYDLDFNPEVTVAPGNIEADYASNVAMRLAKELHRAPMEIAEEIKGALPKEMEIEVVRPGFLNFISSDEYLGAEMGKIRADFDKNIALNEYDGKTVICEFSDPNPFKVLHVGHLYTSIVGDAIARLFSFAGAKVIRANFGGDVGLHVAKTMYALEKKNCALDDLKIEDIAKCYVEGTAAYEDEPEAKERIDELNQEIYRINYEDKHDSPLAELYWRGRELSYQYFEDFYARIGVKFDKYYPESEVAELGLETVLKELKAGVYEKSDGAVIFDGEKYGLHKRVFVNKMGVPTYEAKDVGLIFTKWNDYHFDKSVVITGNEQLDYMKVVLCSVKQYAPELVERTAHLTHGLVKLPGNEKMSSRKGNFLKAVDVLELVQEALAKEYDSDDWRVALAAVKYAFLKYKMGGNIIFDPQESVKMTGNSGPYLLYSCVRAKKILAKNEGVAAAEDLGKLESRERDLIKKILEYKNVLAGAVAEMAPNKVAAYLYELAQEFSRFYEKCPVTGSERAAERLAMVEVYLATMTHGLGILGIEIPEEM